MNAFMFFFGGHPVAWYDTKHGNKQLHDGMALMLRLDGIMMFISDDLVMTARGCTIWIRCNEG